MGILGIINRTENWKTASHLIPLKMNNHVGGLADRLTPNLPHRSEEPELELFWKGMRDFKSQGEVDADTLSQNVTKAYNLRFAGLRRDIQRIGGFNNLRSDNYDVSTPKRQSMLFQNLRNTEVDIVLEDSESLFIGEAKHEMGFGADGKLILVHQLVRQYVMARILVELSVDTEKKKVVPFVVGDDVKKVRQFNQIRFMVNQGWLQEENVLNWQEIREIAG